MRSRKLESSKAIQERIDDLAIEAKALVETAKRESRELNAEESARFDEITDALVPEAKVKLASALKRDEAVLELSNEKRRNNKVEELNEILNRPNSGTREVLPTNGRLPSEGGDREIAIYSRQARLKAFKSDREAYDAGMYIRAIAGRERNRTDVKAEQHCQRRGLDITNDMTTGTGAAGGYLLPAPVAATLIDVREKVGVARKICDIQPMTGDTLTIPKRAGGLTVYAPGEATAFTESDKTMSQVELITKKRAVATQISQELNDDALINVVDNVFSEMGYALALQEDNELINGTGAGATYFGVRGLLNRIGSAGVSTAATGNDTWGELTMADVTACMALLPERFDMSPSWVCSRNFYFGVLLRLEASGGGNTIATLSQGAAGEPMFLGYPVYFTSQMPKTTAAATVCALFGSFPQAVILGDRTGIRISRDDSVGFLSDLITLKATARYDINVHQPGDSSNAGAYVALKTAA
jgi:HK97 family phage major capsid protein